MEFFDAHCHLQDPRYGHERDEIIEAARAAGCRYLVCCATKESDWADVLELSEKYEFILPSLGLHPWFLAERQSGWQNRLADLIKDKNCLLGECGLDGHKKELDLNEQISVFMDHLDLANEFGVPISIHCVKAWNPLLKCLKEKAPLKGGGIIHSYSGSVALLKEFEKLGLCISFSGSVTNENNLKVAKAVQETHPDHLLIETDSPALLPFNLPDRKIGDLNRPANIRR